jgi:hypothetical protein
MGEEGSVTNFSTGKRERRQKGGEVRATESVTESRRAKREVLFRVLCLEIESLVLF